MTKSLTCGCTYDGPVQVLTCPDHNVAQKNLNRAQAMLFQVEIERDQWREKCLALVAWLVARNITGWGPIMADGPKRHE